MNEDKQTRARIAEHLNNESDQITDADIQNAKTEELVVPDNDEADVEEMESLIGTDSLKDNADPEIDNDSWNVLET